MSSKIIVQKRGFQLLSAAIAQLPAFKKSTQWKSYYINAEEPIIERLWHPIKHEGVEKWRVCLHRIQFSRNAFYHPHRHPSAVLVCQGSYEMGTGWGDPDGLPPPIFGPLTVREWDSYQMMNPNCWHYIRPLTGPSYSLMVTGEPYQRGRVSSRPKPRSLTPDEQQSILDFFSPCVINKAQDCVQGLLEETLVALGDN